MTDVPFTRRELLGVSGAGFAIGFFTGSLPSVGESESNFEFSETLRTEHAEVSLVTKSGEKPFPTIEAELHNAVDGLRLAVVKVEFPKGAESIVWEPDSGFYDGILANTEPESVTFTTVAGGETQHQTAVYMSTNE